jgi:hypothetical protein
MLLAMTMTVFEVWDATCMIDGSFLVLYRRWKVGVCRGAVDGDGDGDGVVKVLGVDHVQVEASE